MDAAFINAIDKEGLRARQAVLPSSAVRLDTTILPLVQLTDPEFIDSIIRQHDTSTLILFLSCKHR